jgi:hypothetical protein
MPAKAGIQYAAAPAIQAAETLEYWIPAFAGMMAVFVDDSEA